MSNQDVDRFILDNLPNSFAVLHSQATNYFGQQTYRKVDQRLQSLRKRGLITFDRVKGKGSVWRVNT